ncbi:DUF3304 domain-containing protein [Stenotrophomonas beteli]|uniref:DUF3304 domain-containing protein n=1 Tax=Stenotrophomonas beteli TaxID=3384461 RepID=A0A0R0AMT5_9GAMM|nr:DUF3304 domain-containing protein [Stenotrophomonas maltophilia]KRG46540.1 hypothetical protein ARC23_03755 [Stenotrophomonas maltophilia]
MNSVRGKGVVKKVFVSIVLIGLAMFALAGLALKFMDFRIGPPPLAPPKQRIIEPDTGHDITDAPPEMHLKIGIANYSDEGLGKVFINNVWGGGMQPYASSNGRTCCVTLPRSWHPGLKVAVAYRTSSMFLKDPQSYVEKDVLVAPYEPFIDGFIYFFYFPGDQVRVVATPYSPGYPGFAYDIDFGRGHGDPAKIKRFLEATAGKEAE